MRHVRVSIVVLLMPGMAFAYIDPGSGILLWQGVIAAVGVALVIVRNPGQFFKSIIERFRSRRDPGKDPD